LKPSPSINQPWKSLKSTPDAASGAAIFTIRFFKQKTPKRFKQPLFPLFSFPASQKSFKKTSLNTAEPIASITAPGSLSPRAFIHQEQAAIPKPRFKIFD
jgi:hypothetical protein